jgi:hypothetical protein
MHCVFYAYAENEAQRQPAYAKTTETIRCRLDLIVVLFIIDVLPLISNFNQLRKCLIGHISNMTVKEEISKFIDLQHFVAQSTTYTFVLK